MQAAAASYSIATPSILWILPLSISNLAIYGEPWSWISNQSISMVPQHILDFQSIYFSGSAVSAFQKFSTDHEKKPAPHF